MTADTGRDQFPDRERVRIFQDNLDGEIDGVAVYRMLAETEHDAERKSIFQQLAEVEERHANTWRRKLREAGVEPREHGPSLRVRFVGFLARRFGVMSVLPIVHKYGGRGIRNLHGPGRDSAGDSARRA